MHSLWPKLILMRPLRRVIFKDIFKTNRKPLHVGIVLLILQCA